MNCLEGIKDLGGGLVFFPDFFGFGFPEVALVICSVKPHFRAVSPNQEMKIAESILYPLKVSKRNWGIFSVDSISSLIIAKFLG